MTSPTRQGLAETSIASMSPTTSGQALNDAQAQAVYASRHTLIQALAGAGAGKTLLIAHRFVHLLRELQAEDVDAPHTRILAVTFTVKAAAEMRERIQRYLGEDDPLDEGAAIGNFHGFCNRLLRRHALAMGLPPGFTILAGLERQIFLDVFLRHLRHGDYADIQSALAQAGLSDVLAPNLLSLEASRDLPVPSLTALIAELPAVLGAIKSTGLSPRRFRELARAQAQALTQALMTLPQTGFDGDFLGDSQAYATLWDQHLAPWTSPEGSFCDGASHGEETEKFYQKRLEWLNKNWKSQTPVGPLRLFPYAYYNRMRRDAQPDDVQVLARIGEDEARLIDWTAAAYALYQEKLREQGARDFDDLINDCLTLFERRPDILASNREQFEAIIVDEFQDSNGSQLALLRALMRPQAPALTVVGDRKQSIYRFRHARPENMERIFEGLTPKRITLRENYRSTANILAVANVLAQAVTGDDQQRLEASAPHAEDGPPVLWVELGRRDPDAPDQLLKEPVSDLRAREAQWIAAQVARLIADGQAKPDEITLLVKNHHKAAGLECALRALGIPTITRKNAGFFDEPIIRDAMAVLRLLRRPTDAAAWTRLLQRKLSQRCLLEIRSLARARQTSFWGALRALSDVTCLPNMTLAVRKALLSLVEAVIAARAALPKAEPTGVFWRLADAIGLIDPAAPVDAREEARLSLEAFAALLRQLSRRREAGSGSSRVVAPSLDDIVEALAAARQGDALEMPVGDAQGDPTLAVEILTVHAAKGLENRIVFVAYADARVKRPNGFLLRFDPLNAQSAEEPGYGLILGQHALSADSGQATLKRRMYQRRWDAPQAQMEEKRLFYVATTRARERLIVTRSDYAPSWTAWEAFPAEVQRGAMTLLREADDPEAFSAQMPDVAEGRLLRDAVRARLEALSQIKSPVNASRTETAQGIDALDPEDDVLSPPPLTLSFSALQRLRQCPVRYWLSVARRLPEPPLSDGRARPPDSRERDVAIAIGVATHALIEYHYLARGDFNDEQQEKALNSVNRPMTSGALEETRARVWEKARALYRSFLESPFTYTALVSRGLSPQPEARLRFTWPSAGILIDAKVDALLRDARNGAVRGVVEFKTNETLDAPRRLEYAQQLALYREGLQACEGQSVPDASILPDDALTLAHLTPSGLLTPSLESQSLSLAPLKTLAQTAAALSEPASQAPARPAGLDCQACDCPYQRVCPQSSRLGKRTLL